MEVVHKKVLEIKDTQWLTIKDLAEILSVTTQKDELVLYYTVDKEVAHTSFVHIAIYGTGIEYPCSNVEGKQFMGSHMTYNDNRVWHAWLSVRV